MRKIIFALFVLFAFLFGVEASVKDKAAEAFHNAAAKVDGIVGNTANQKKHEAAAAGYQAKATVQDKAAEAYHRTAAKVDGLVGDRAGQLEHEAKAAALDPQTAAQRAADAAQGKGPIDKLKEWTGLGKDKKEEVKVNLKEGASILAEKSKDNLEATKQFADNAKEYAKDRAQAAKDAVEAAKAKSTIPDKAAEAYHRAAAKVDGLVGDRVGQLEHEAKAAYHDPEMAAKRAADAVQGKGPIDKLKEWTGLGKDKSEEVKENFKEGASNLAEKSKDNLEATKNFAENAKEYAKERAQAVKEAYEAAKAKL